MGLPFGPKATESGASRRRFSGASPARQMDATSDCSCENESALASPSPTRSPQLFALLANPRSTKTHGSDLSEASSTVAARIFVMVSRELRPFGVCTGLAAMILAGRMIGLSRCGCGFRRLLGMTALSFFNLILDQARDHFVAELSRKDCSDPQHVHRAHQIIEEPFDLMFRHAALGSVHKRVAQDRRPPVWPPSHRPAADRRLWLDLARARAAEKATSVVGNPSARNRRSAVIVSRPVCIRPR